MKKSTLITLVAMICLLCKSTLFYGQGYEPYTWEETRSITALDSTASKYGLYYILRNEEYHYEYDLSLIHI